MSDKQDQTFPVCRAGGKSEKWISLDLIKRYLLLRFFATSQTFPSSDQRLQNHKPGFSPPQIQQSRRLHEVSALCLSAVGYYGPEPSEQSREMQPLWSAIEREAGGRWRWRGDDRPTQRGFQADSDPLRPVALCFVTSLLEHNADANEEPLRNWRRWWDGTLLLMFDTSAPPPPQSHSADPNQVDSPRAKCFPYILRSRTRMDKTCVIKCGVKRRRNEVKHKDFTHLSRNM